jgi:hypothetical protein
MWAAEMDWVDRLFSTYKRTLVEKNQENKIMLSIHSTLDTKSGVFERVFFLPEKVSYMVTMVAGISSKKKSF